MMRMYLSNRKDSGYAVALTLVGNGTLPVFAFIISRMAAPPLIFLSYLLTELLVFALSMRRYRWWLAKDRKEQLDNEEEVVLYMTIRPEDAVEASRSLRAFADENGIDKRVAYRIALCMEEMVASCCHSSGNQFLSLICSERAFSSSKSKSLVTMDSQNLRAEGLVS